MENPINLEANDGDSESEENASMIAIGDKRKSPHWNHFVVIRNEKTKKIENAICKYCTKVLQASTIGGTTVLIKHLKSCASYPFNIDKKQKKISIYKDTRTESVTVSNWVYDGPALRMALAHMMIVDEQPFAMVECQGFRHFISVGIPQFSASIPSRFTVARDCHKLYVFEKESLRNMLKCLKSRISLTTDCWTSNQNLNYLCFTAHFIDDDWKLHKRILNFKLMDSHKGKAIGSVVEKCVIEWGIEDKLSCLTVDNASSNNVAIRYLIDNLGDKLMLNGEFFHMRCAAHVLNRVVSDGLSMVKDSIHNIRNAVRYIRSSPERSTSFDSCAKVVKIPTKGFLCLDVCTRWNSTYLMLNMALKFEKAFERFNNDDSHYLNDLNESIPTRMDWENARILSKFLEQFYEATKRMSGISWEDEACPKLKNMAIKMHTKFDNYYGDWAKTNLMVLLAVVFDPRYKLNFVRYSFRRIYLNDLGKADKVHDHLYSVLNRLFVAYSSMINDGKDDNIASSSPLNIDTSTIAMSNEHLTNLYKGWDEGEDEEFGVVKKLN